MKIHDVLARVREAELGVALSGELRTYLEEFGQASICNCHFFGLGTEVADPLELVPAMARARRAEGSALPPCLVPIWADGAGGRDCYDAAAGFGDRAPVAESYVSWLAGRMNWSDEGRSTIA